jgi:exonuclease III
MLKDNNISICCVSETWLKLDDRAKFAEIHDFGFDVISAPRRGRGGGVAFLYDPQLLNPVRNDVKKYSSFEVVECVIKTADRTVRLCVVYRSTQAKTKYEETKISKFFEDFEDYLDNLCEKTGSPIICGDFNLHVEDLSNSCAQNFIAMCESKGFTQHVRSTTHISGGTLDLVLTMNDCIDALPLNNMSIEPHTGTSSDHFLVSFQIPVTLDNKKKRTYEEKEVRELSKINLDSFREDLFCSPLNHSEFTSLDQAVTLYQKVVEDILDKHAPLITKKFSAQKSEFWNEKCQEAVRTRRKARRKYDRAKKKYNRGQKAMDPINHPEDQKAKDLKNHLEDLRADFHEKCVDSEIVINRARNSFYDRQLSACKGDSRGTYKVINKLLDKEYGTNKLPNGDAEDVAEKLKDFFDQKIKTIYTKIKGDVSSSPKMDMDPAIDDEITYDKCSLSQFSEISEPDLVALIKDLPNKSSSLDSIPMWLFKHCLPELLSIVHYIVNESLRSGKFPSALKTASIRPGLKKPTLDVDDLKNYRPISNLTYLSKILEKVVHHQLNDYVNLNGLYSSHQSGYRKFHSCETAVTKIHNDILMLIDKKENVLLLLLDLSAAFDTINHDLLLKKLHSSFGIMENALNWLRSYLSNRTFKVSVNKGSSSQCTLDIGVPQGSILGPLLFILYTKDLECIVSKYGFSVHLYADDTQIYFSFDIHSDNPNLVAIKACFQEIKEWMAKNFLKLNEDKTELLDIGPYVSTVKSLNLGSLDINPVETAKNLGFLFDHQLNLDAQVNAVTRICFLNQRNLSKIGSKLSLELKIQMVHSNILCFIDYCNSAYFGLTEKNLQKLQKIQNNAVRFIYGLYGKKRRESITPYLEKLHFLPVRWRIRFKIALLVFKCINNLAPNYLKNLIHLRDVKRRSSRLDDDFFLLKIPPKTNLSRSESAFSICGPKIWNELPFDVRCLACIDSFKSALKTFYFNKAFKSLRV